MCNQEEEDGEDEPKTVVIVWFPVTAWLSYLSLNVCVPWSAEGGRCFQWVGSVVTNILLLLFILSSRE